MEQNTQRRLVGLKDKIPDIQKTLETVRFLQGRKVQRPSHGVGRAKHWFPAQADADPIETTFELNDTLYAKAEVPPTDEVYLWLGANVMLAYPIPEAEQLLKSKLDTAKRSLETCEEDMEFLREQITTLEVAFARVYNWDVAQRRKEREAGESIEDKKGSSSNGWWGGHKHSRIPHMKIIHV
jgi:prefoldin subunit 5